MGALAAWRSRPSACSSRSSARSSIHHIVTYRWIALGFAIGAVVGGTMGLRIPMTAVPQRTALSHSLGALAACLVGVSEYFRYQGELGRVTLTALDFEVIVGGAHLHGQPDRRGQAPGAAARAADHLPRPERPRASACSRSSSASGGLPGRHAGGHAVLLRDGGAVARLRPPARHPDRRGRHAGGDRAPQLVRRARRRRDGLRADEQDPDHHGLARRHLGLPARAAHVPRDEPLGDERAVRRLRQGLGGGRGGRRPRRRAPCAASRPRRRPCSSRPRSNVIIVPGYGMAVAQAQHAVAELAQHPRRSAAST